MHGAQARPRPAVTAASQQWLALQARASATFRPATAVAWLTQQLAANEQPSALVQGHKGDGAWHSDRTSVPFVGMVATVSALPTAWRQAVPQLLFTCLVFVALLLLPMATCGTPSRWPCTRGQLGVHRCRQAPEACEGWHDSPGGSVMAVVFTPRRSHLPTSVSPPAPTHQPLVPCLHAARGCGKASSPTLVAASDGEACTCQDQRHLPPKRQQHSRDHWRTLLRWTLLLLAQLLSFAV